MKKDNLIFGLILGFITPLFGLTIYYFLGFYKHDVGVGEYLDYFRQRKFLTAVGSLALIANTVVFSIYVNRRYQTARGIFAATMVYAIIVLLIKIIG